MFVKVMSRCLPGEAPGQFGSGSIHDCWCMQLEEENHVIKRGEDSLLQSKTCIGRKTQGIVTSILNYQRSHPIVSKTNNQF